ncbi:MAG: YbhN family protein [Acidimicrobiales bacterium]
MPLPRGPVPVEGDGRADGAAPPGRHRAPVRRQALVQWTLTALVLGATGAAALRSGDAIGQAMTRLRSVGPASLAALLTCWAVSSASRGWAVALSVPGLSVRRGVMAAEAVTGIGNALPGGVAIGQTIRIAMCRSWGAAASQIVLSFLTTGTVTMSVLWLLALAALAPELGGGRAGPGEWGAAALGVVIVGGAAAAWAGALTEPVFSLVRGPALRVVERLGRRVWPAGTRAGDELEELRRAGRRMWRRRGVALAAAGLGYQLGLAAVLLSALRTVDTAGLSSWDAFRSFALVRAATWLVPTPGGLGAVDAGLTAALVDAGAAPPDAIAAVLLYRAVTFVLPILTGLACSSLWRLQQRRADKRPGDGGPAQSRRTPGPERGPQHGDDRPAPAR